MLHSFDTDVAEEYGVNAAIVLNSLYLWIEHNRANDVHKHDGRYWTYQSTKAFAVTHSYLSKKQIETALSKLIENGLIIKSNFNKSAYDRTLWYALTDKGQALCEHSPFPLSGKSISPTGEMEITSGGNGFHPQGKPIPLHKELHTNITINNNIVEQVVHLYESICVSYPKLKVVSEKRKADIRKLLKTVTIEQVEEAFILAEHNNFLKGLIVFPTSKFNRPFKANFDWLIVENNMVKVLNGKYSAWDDRQEEQGKDNYSESDFFDL